MELDFKRGSKYTRRSIGEICYPGVGRPSGGNWDTGYTSLKPPLEDNLIVFMNIGFPGRLGLDFPNKYDDEKKIITWYGKPNAHSEQKQIKKIIDKEITPHFFARWDSKPEFIYLGVGNVISYKDGVSIPGDDRKTIEFELLVDDIGDIFTGTPLKQVDSSEIDQPSTISNLPMSSFALEKHLEDYIVRNWSSTIFAEKYDFYERQYQTNTGPLDILAKSKDGSEYLVIELKRDLASDIVVGQTSRYMGYIKNNLADENESVKGCIVANQADAGLKNALSAIDSIDFYEYSIEFIMNKVEI